MGVYKLYKKNQNPLCHLLYAYQQKKVYDKGVGAIVVVGRCTEAGFCSRSRDSVYLQKWRNHKNRQYSTNIAIPGRSIITPASFATMEKMLKAYLSAKVEGAFLKLSIFGDGDPRENACNSHND